MTPLQDRTTINLESWATSLPEPQALALLQRAAENHPTLKISDPQTVAQYRLGDLRKGFNALPKPYRDYLAREFLKAHDGLMA